MNSQEMNEDDPKGPSPATPRRPHETSSRSRSDERRRTPRSKPSSDFRLRRATSRSHSDEREVPCQRRRRFPTRAASRSRSDDPVGDRSVKKQAAAPQLKPPHAKPKLPDNEQQPAEPAKAKLRVRSTARRSPPASVGRKSVSDVKRELNGRTWTWLKHRSI